MTADAAAPLRLGALALSGRFLLAPLESVSDAAFRRLCREQGAALTFTEMVRARGIIRRNAATLALIDTHEADAPVGLQLLVTGEEELQRAWETLESLSETPEGARFRHIAVVDLNLGCPSPDVINIGAGPALLKRRHKLARLFARLAQLRRASRLPVQAVGAKLRLGLHRAEQDAKVYLSAAEAADGVLDYLTVHARHARQDSTSPAFWPAIAEVKARVSLPVLGNGDALDATSAQELLRQTGCDGVLVARGAIRSPWIFRELRGAGAGLPTLEELEHARGRYLEEATRLESREKFLAWHREGFARLEARVQGRAPGGPAEPRTVHL